MHIPPKALRQSEAVKEEAVEHAELARLSRTELHEIKNASATLIRIKVQHTQIAWVELQTLPGDPHSASLENEPDSGIRDETFRGQQRTRKGVVVVLLLSPIQVRRVKIGNANQRAQAALGAALQMAPDSEPCNETS